MARRGLAFDYHSELDTMRARSRTRNRMTSLVMLGIMGATVAAAGLLVYASVRLAGLVADVFGRAQGEEVRSEALPAQSLVPAGVVMILPAALRR